jgi:hypothetical protein
MAIIQRERPSVPAPMPCARASA